MSRERVLGVWMGRFSGLGHREYLVAGGSWGCTMQSCVTLSCTHDSWEFRNFINSGFSGAFSAIYWRLLYKILSLTLENGSGSGSANSP